MLLFIPIFYPDCECSPHSSTLFTILLSKDTACPTVFSKQLNAHTSHASNDLNLNKLFFDNTVLWVIPMGYTMPSRKDAQTMTGNNLSPSSLQCRHLQKIVGISLPNPWKAYRSSWEFFFQILHLTKKIRLVPVS